MTQAATITPLAGSAPIGNWLIPDNLQRHPLGMIVDFIDPFFGGGEAIYLQMPLSTLMRVGTVLAYDTVTSGVASPVANTANLGKSLALLLNRVESLASAQFGWALISGQAPIFSAASITADTALGIVAAGQAGAVSAGKQILNARVTKPATTTVLKPNAQVQAGSSLIKVSNTDGWFLGVSVSGTGIVTSVITAIEPINRTVRLASAATASGSVTATGTYNDATNFFNVVTFSRLCAQGAIT